MTDEVGALGAEAVHLLDAVAERLVAARQRYGGSGAPEGVTASESGDGAGDAAASGGDGAGEGTGSAADDTADDGDADGHAQTPVSGGDDASADPMQGRGTGSVACPTCGHDPAHPSTCTSCPICLMLAVLRGERPDTAAKLIDGALTVVQVLRGLLTAADGHPIRMGGDGGGTGRSAPAGETSQEQGAAAAASGGDGRDAPRDPGASSPGPGGVVRIDIR